jgi:exopolyphosphatase/guanosine-5'-triphosphate,3'-diphosphate pyrophosphatase
MKVAALDLGTNSFLCLIAKVEGGKITEILSDEMKVVRLGQDVSKNRHFHPDALARARQCLSEFKTAIERHKPERILAMATSAARDVTNADELFQIGRDLQIPIEIIPGEKEAEITFFGSISGLPLDEKVRAVIDVGGGSTEIICGTHKKILAGKSINIGAVRLTEKFLPQQPASQKEYEAMTANVESEMKSLTAELKTYGIQEIIAVAGTPTELARVTLGGFDPKKIDGLRFSKQDLQEWLHKIQDLSPEERAQKYGFASGRADIIYVGIAILLTALKQLQIPSMTVSTRGVRFGVALELARR